MAKNFINKVLEDNSDESDNDANIYVNDVVSDELIFNPYNHLNKEINIGDVQELLKTYGIFTKPFNMELYNCIFIIY